MLFANKLEHEIYKPWKEYYLNYNGLKKLLKEGVILQNNWSDKDEQNFVSALDSDLEKVYTFQHNKYEELNDKLNELQSKTENAERKFEVDKFTTELDELLNAAQDLEHFQRLNYTGFIKIVKKHDRLHPSYSVKPLLNVRLKSLPFHSEDYSPLLYKIGALFQFLRDNYNVDQSISKLSSFTESSANTEYQSFKFWIHPENLMEVKTTLLRHLPVLVYNNKRMDGDDVDDDDEDEEDGESKNTQSEQNVNCLYFDNDHFEVYNSKLTKISNSSTLRLKWIGKLQDKPNITLEKKQFDSNSNFHLDDKISLKQKYIGDYIIKKEIPTKLKKINDPESLNNVLAYIKENNLQPVLRTVYKRTAFQIPGDDKVRVIIDSNLTFIREDSFDQQLPIRDPSSWHRTDIDSKASNPLQYLRKGEFSKFPYSVMEIKIKKSALKTSKKLNWINELISSSHLIKEIPNFSKFIHGIAALFIEDEKLENVPLWYNELENDLSFNPELYLKKARIASEEESRDSLTNEDNLSKFKDMISKNNSSTFQPRSASFSGSLLLNLNSKDENLDGSKPISSALTEIVEETNATTQSSDFDDEDDEDEFLSKSKRGPLAKIWNIPNQFSKLIDADSEDEEIELPMGVTKPDSWIKNAGPLKIEPKVWLANERTFNRWLHVTTLLSSLTFVLYSSSQKSNFSGISDYLAYFYFALTLFSGVWGYYIFLRRRSIIMERSGKHLDNIIGPLIIALGLVFALIFNFIFGWRNLNVDLNDPFYETNSFHKYVHEFVLQSV
ncbi:SPX-domain-containing protein [Suhomyces tanzawaensis NRRL Y-17324]|uniref:SPX-domain-containing protein n=1 Tax=Suhomyces tanzawaensis NRRL Y-17324 TaxID=984487 RepID=A0A1E4SK80_9ASCO|nr:SPX-domain-containing protein [Suhomyces tanzawaensis NRRL Y-17324]ODV79916.1 SPX-domain-containing protein [Suhomyces tanzawaensis NRRL Y-17324]